MEVHINPGHVENHGIEIDGEEALFPDILCVEDEQIRFICEIETDSTVSEDAVEQWSDYASFEGANFILVVPEELERTAQELTSENNIECHGIILYQPDASSA